MLRYKFKLETKTRYAIFEEMRMKRVSTSHLSKATKTDC